MTQLTDRYWLWEWKMLECMWMRFCCIHSSNLIQHTTTQHRQHRSSCVCPCAKTAACKGETLEGFFPLVDFPTMCCMECLLRMRHRAPIPSAIIWDRIGNRVRKIMPMELMCRVCGVYRPFLWTEWRWCGMLDPNYFWEGGCFSFLTFDRGLRRIKSWKWDIFLSKCVSPFS